MKKRKCIATLSTIAMTTSLLSTSVFAYNVKGNETKLKNEATLTLDTEKNEYTIEQNGKVEKGSLGTTVAIGTDYFYNITNFTSIDNGKLTVKSASNNPGNLHVKAVKSSSGTIHYSTGSKNLAPGGSWTTAGGLSITTKYTIIAKASKAGTYTLNLKW